MTDFIIRELKDQTEMIVIDFFVNVCESMGANIINTIVESVSPVIQGLTEGRVGIKVLSNLTTERRVLCQFQVPVKKMVILRDLSVGLEKRLRGGSLREVFGSL